MSGLTTTVAAETIREVHQPGFVEGVYRNNKLFSNFPAWARQMGDTAYRWKVNHSANSGLEVFTEGQPQPQAGSQGFVTPYVSWTYFRIMLEYTGHARDALQSNYIPHITEEGNLGRDDLIDLMTTSFMGSTYGLELAIDYGSAYAGVTRNGAAGYFEATETAVNDKLAWSDLRDLKETVRNADKGSTGPWFWLCNLNQESNIYELTGSPVIRMEGDGDLSPRMTSPSVDGDKVVALPDFTTTVIALIDAGAGNWAPTYIRDFEVLDMGPTSDNHIFQLSWGGAFVCRNPKVQGKLTGVTA